MQDILPTAAYVKTTSSVHADSAATVRSIAARQGLPSEATALQMFELLDTPQTVETLRRVLEKHCAPGQGASMATIQRYLAELYQRDLIEISPDT